MEVTITLTDNEDGTINVVSNFGGSLDDTSPAHKTAYHMLSSLKEVLTHVSPEPKKSVTDAEDKE